MRHKTIATTLAAVLAAAGLAACGGEETTTVTTGTGPTAASEGLPQGSEPANLDPAEFTAEIDNEWWPLAVGSRWVYRETDSEGTEQKVVVTVLDKTKTIANGVEARVVRDVVTEDGMPVEVTDDWYAQDADGNVWYFGEDTRELEGGEVVSTAGSWEAGVDGALPGIVMLADPRPGDTYRQEYYAGEAEDLARVLRLDGTAEVPYGRFEHVLVTEDWTPLEPDVAEHKSYARGIGLVMEVLVRGGEGEVRLVEVTPAPAGG